MEIFLDALTDASIDLLKILPFLLAVHILIEVIEQSAGSRMRLGKLLNGGLAPLAAGGLGMIPQCGFSVVATKLFSKQNIKVGTLIAVFIATSDEALPILISTPNAWGKILPLLIIKLVYAVIAGYALNLIFRKKQTAAVNEDAEPVRGCCGHVHGGEEQPELPHKTGSLKKYPDEQEHHDGHRHTDEHEHPHGQKTDGARSRAARRFFDRYLKHPLIHTLTIAAFILAVNLVFNLLFGFVGEERIIAFLDANRYAQPFIAGLIGLIPNCGASVVITQSYALGGLSLGGAIAGLSVTAGIAYAVLFKENKNLRQNLLIVGGLYTVSCLLGLGISLLGF